MLGRNFIQFGLLLRGFLRDKRELLLLLLVLVLELQLFLPVTLFDELDLLLDQFNDFLGFLVALLRLPVLLLCGL